MANIALTLTDAGKTALATAQGNNTAFTITRLKLGTANYTPDGTETDITTPFDPVREFTNPAGSASGNSFQFVFQDDSSDTYTVGELGVFAGDVLFAIASDTSDIFTKGSAPLVIPSIYTFATTSTGNITFNASATFVAATTEAAGLIEIATNTEAATGTDTNRAVTPAGMHGYVEGLFATQTEYNNSTSGKLVSANLNIDASKIAGHIGQGRFSVASAATAVTASANDPKILNVTGADEHGKVILGAGTVMPVLAVNNITVAGGNTEYVYSSGLFNNIRLHTAGTAQYDEGDEVYISESDFTTFSSTAPTGGSHRPVGIVVGGVGTNGRYDVVFDFWGAYFGLTSQQEVKIEAHETSIALLETSVNSNSTQLGNLPGQIHISANAPTASDGNNGDVWIQT